LHYPDGLEVQVRNGRVTGRDGRLVRIAATGEREVTVVVRRR
jgi:hypothetical protein